MARKILHDMQDKILALEISLNGKEGLVCEMDKQVGVLQVALIEREEALAAKEQQIALLEEEVRRLRAAGKPAPKPLPEGVRLLAVLTPDPLTGRAVCAIHGSVSPNVRRQCPACYCAAVKAAAGVKEAAAA